MRWKQNSSQSVIHIQYSVHGESGTNSQSAVDHVLYVMWSVKERGGGHKLLQHSILCPQWIHGRKGLISAPPALNFPS